VVAAGEALLAPAITRRLIEEFVRRPAPGSVAPAEISGATLSGSVPPGSLRTRAQHSYACQSERPRAASTERCAGTSWCSPMTESAR
jgi:hypothetical protein